VSRRDVPVTLPRAHFEVDGDGHLSVTVDGRPWRPPADDPTKPANLGTVRLGRSDVLWARQQIANELGTPVLVEIVDTGKPYSDVIDPDGYRTTEPPETRAASEAPDGPYTPGEPLVISVVIGHTHADERGRVRYRLPSALGDRAVQVHGKTSGTTLPLALSPRSQPSGDAVEAPSQASVMGRIFDARRRQPGSGHARRPLRPAPDPARQAAPDDGLGAL
jgi:hypothetical protein